MKKSIEYHYLKELIKANELFLAKIDEIMALPASNERGKHIAKLCNYLEIQKDIAWHFGLSKPFKKNKVRKVE